MSEDSGNKNGGSREKSLLEVILSFAQAVAYYAVTVFLIAGIVVLCVSVVSVFVQDVLAYDALQATLDILDRVLLITIFIELLITIEVLVREGQIVAEPFILVALVAVVRRILLITAEVKQNMYDPETYINLITELGVLTALVVALAGALWVARRAVRRQEEPAT
jgi:uncharacterized membrane protein (DUF373 family)